MKSKTFKPNKDLQEYTQKLITLFTQKYGFGRYAFKVKFVERIASGRKWGSMTSEGCTAEIEIDSRYFDVNLYFSRKWERKFKEEDYEVLAQDMCHEFAHILSDPYYEFFWDQVDTKSHKSLQIINEQQTQRIASAIMVGVRPKEYLP